MRQWLHEQWRLRRLRKDADLTDKAFADELDRARKADVPYQHMGAIEHGRYFEMSTIEDEIEWIKTKRALRQATKYSVQLPKQVEGDDWRKSDRLGVWVLTTAGAMKIRREVAVEVEIQQKPWLNWISLVVSGGSLAIALMAFLSAQEAPANSELHEPIILQEDASIMTGLEPTTPGSTN